MASGNGNDKMKNLTDDVEKDSRIQMLDDSAPAWVEPTTGTSAGRSWWIKTILLGVCSLLLAFVAGGLVGARVVARHYQQTGNNGQRGVAVDIGSCPSDLFVPINHTGELTDPLAPWNLPAHPGNAFDPSVMKVNASDPSLLEFLPGDLDDEELAKLERFYRDTLREQEMLLQYTSRGNDPATDALIDQVDASADTEDNAGETRRELATWTAPEFHEPLPCNNVQFDCTLQPLSSLSVTTGQPLVIPCGQCYYIDEMTHGVLEYPDGVLVQGKLYSPPTANAIIRTTHVVVEGILEMEEPYDGNEVVFRLYGSSDVVFTPHSQQPNGQACTSGCSIGAKPIVVAGGTCLCACTKTTVNSCCGFVRGGDCR